VLVGRLCLHRTRVAHLCVACTVPPTHHGLTCLVPGGSSSITPWPSSSPSSSSSGCISRDSSSRVAAPTLQSRECGLPYYD
jgi:hypothetical protein